MEQKNIKMLPALAAAVAVLAASTIAGDLIKGRRDDDALATGDDDSSGSLVEDDDSSRNSVRAKQTNTSQSVAAVGLSVPPLSRAEEEMRAEDLRFEEGRKNFKLDEEIIQDHGDIASIEHKLDPDTRFTISAAYKNTRSAERFMKKAEEGRPTGSVEAQIEVVEECLSKLKNSEHSADLEDFIQEIEEKIAVLKARFENLGKSRCKDSVYREYCDSYRDDYSSYR